MELNISKLVNKLRLKHRFRFETETLGILLVHDFSLSVFSAIEKKIQNGELDTPTELAIELICLTCQFDNKDGEYTEERISDGEAKNSVKTN